MSEKTIGFFCLLLAALIWGGFWVVSRYGMTQTSLQPADIMALRFAVAGIVMLPLLFRMGLGIKWWQAIVLAAAGGLFNSLLAVMGVVYAPAAHGATLMPGLAPIFTAIITWLLLDEEISTTRWLGIMVIVAGAFLLGSQNFANANSEQWLGHLCFVGASILWSIYIVLMRAWNIGAIKGVAIITVISMVFYLPVYSFIYGGRMLDYPVEDIALQAVFHGIFSAIGAFYLFNRGIAAFGASAAGAASAMIPVLTVMLSFFFIGEVPSWTEFLGIAVVTVGLPVAMGAKLMTSPSTPIRSALGRNVDTRA